METWSPWYPTMAEEIERLFNIRKDRTDTGRSLPASSVAVKPPCSMSRFTGPEDDDFERNGRSSELDAWDYLMIRPKQREQRRQSQTVMTKSELMALLAHRERLPVSRKKRGASVCVFCKNNGESEVVYSSHVLKDGAGRVTCPVLRAYTCPLCAAHGDNAHTIKYCPLGEVARPSCLPLRSARNSIGGRKR